MSNKRRPKRPAAPSADATAEGPNQPYRPPAGVVRPTDDEEISRVVLDEKGRPARRRHRDRQRLGTVARIFALAGSLVAVVAVIVMVVAHRSAATRFGVDLWQVARPVDDPAVRQLASLFDVGTLGALVSLALMAPGLVLGVLSVRGTGASSRGRTAVALAIVMPILLGVLLFVGTS